MQRRRRALVPVLITDRNSKHFGNKDSKLLYLLYDRKSNLKQCLPNMIKCLALGKVALWKIVDYNVSFEKKRKEEEEEVEEVQTSTVLQNLSLYPR